MQTFGAAPFPANEGRQLAAPEDDALLDTSSEALLGALAAVAAEVCGTPTALITAIDRGREWFITNVPLACAGELARSRSFCAATVAGRDFDEIPDTHLDPRCAADPLVVGEPGVRFYAGMPFVTADGQTFGTLCVLDREPRTLAPEARAALRKLVATIAGYCARRADHRPAATPQRYGGIAQAPPGVDWARVVTAALDGVREAVLITTVGSGADDPGTIVYANEAFAATVRAAPIEIVGRRADAFFDSDADSAAIAAMQAELRAGRHVRAALIAYRADGTAYRCVTDARPVCAAAAAVTHAIYVQRDDPNAGARELSLAALNDRLTTLTEVARSLFAALDPRALVDALLRGVAQLTGGGTAQVLARGTDAAFIETHDLSKRAETAVANDAFVCRAATHDGVLLEAGGRRAAVPILAPAGIVSYLLDIRAGERSFVDTDAFAFGLLGQYVAVAVRNVELYGELAARRAAVIELNQVKNDLIAMLAHDFKGPLTTIVGLADVLAEDERFDAESRQFLSMINSSAMRLATLATDTLAMSRLEQNELSLRFDRVDIVQLLRDIVRVLGVTRGIDLRSPVEVMIVRADAARLRQVFENIVGNAIKYSPRGETVTVTVREKHGGADVVIRDRGIGIPAADAPKLFGRFARASNAREMGIGGTGFGLYLSKTIIEMHGGHIDVESKEGVGSTFRVFVPTIPAPQPTLDRRVLLLEGVGEGEGRSFIAHTLRDEGYTVHTVPSETELLHALEDGRYDAAIVDVDRLVISAAELLDRIAHRTTLVRLVSTAEAEGTGWNAALRKPFLIKDLQVVLESAVAERRRAPRGEADSS